MSSRGYVSGVILALLFCCEIVPSLYAEDVSDTSVRIWQAKDSLSAATDTDPVAEQCLKGLCWIPGSFAVSSVLEPEQKWDSLVQFPSPIDSGNRVNDLVSMEWYYARLEGKRVHNAPAIVVVHESGSRMEVGKIFAQSLSNLGFHAFMIQLPYYGNRRESGKAHQQANQILAMQQAVADVRRARDAVSILPDVDQRLIALQGTSLGGFVATTAASLDASYDAVFLMLAGGDLYDIIQNGEKDAAKARERLAKNGYTGEKLKSLARQVEPTNVAHRLNPERVWLYSGLYDKVVPFKNAKLLADKMQIPESHHIGMPSNHYSGVVFLPMVLTHIQQQINFIQAQGE